MFFSSAEEPEDEQQTEQGTEKRPSVRLEAT